VKLPQQQLELQQISPSMDYQVPESVPLLTGASGRQQQKAEVKRSKLLTVCPFILGGWCVGVAVSG
jgi:hypothetical protein